MGGSGHTERLTNSPATAFRIGIDLISYQNDRKDCAMIAGKVESVSEHAAACIGMLTDH
jgi:hypothetical protein